MGSFTKICRESPYLAKMEKNIGKLTRRPKHVLLLFAATLNRNKRVKLLAYQAF